MNAAATFTWPGFLFLCVFFFLYFGVPALLVWVSYSERPAFRPVDIRALWMWNDRPDKLAVIILGTWWVHTCSMILWSLKGVVATTDYLTYMGWALPIIANMFVPKPGTVVTERTSEPAAPPGPTKTTDKRTETPPIAGAQP
jgi:hypothetical protein